MLKSKRDRPARQRIWFLSEFMDQDWVPASLHATLRDVLGFHLRVTLGYYYVWAAKEVLDRAKRLGIRRVAELGAGSAGLSEVLARRIKEEGASLSVEVSDVRPQPSRYRELELEFPGIITVDERPVDFLAERPASPDVLVLMSAAFHHIPPAQRPRVLAELAVRRVAIFESVTRNAASILGCAIGFLPAMLTPLYFVGQPVGRWRRFFWCWLVPVAPFMVAWDGVVSCLRCWTEDEWREQLADAGVPPERVAIARRRFSHMISW